MSLREKDYKNWMIVKKKIHSKTLSSKKHHTRVRRGEVYWASIGENIGHEQDGKGNAYSRPVLVYQVFSYNTVLIIPLTRNGKKDKFHCQLELNNAPSFASHSQVKSCDTIRLGTNKIGRLSKLDFYRLSLRFRALID